MKTHLFRPGEFITMCGIQLKSFSTTDPLDVDCIRCLGMYHGNINWYWHKLSRSTPAEIPVGVRWSVVDTPMFHPITIQHQFPFSWALVIKDWGLDYSLRKEAGDGNVLRSH